MGRIVWIQFFIASICAVCVLILPALGPLRALGLYHLEGICFAPIASISLVSVLCVSYGQAGIPANWMTVLLPLLALSLLLGVLAQTRASADGASKAAGVDARMLLMYLVIGVLISGWFFVRTLNGPDSFSQEHDNIHHLLQAKAFLETGDMSTLHVDLYAIKALKGTPTPTPTGYSFYPSGWHCLVALTASLTRCGVPIAQNATIFVFLALVFPLSAFIFLSRIFSDEPLSITSGSILALAFSAFPWQMLIFGPLYPNFGAFCLVPLVATAFMGMCEEWHERGMAYLALFLTGGVSLGFMHPNAVFTTALILFPYCMTRMKAFVSAGVRNGKMGKGMGATLVCVLVLLFVMLWYVLCGLPVFKNTVGFSWSQMSPPKDQVMNILTLSFRARSAQVFLGTLVMVGLVSITRDRARRWIALSYALVFAICFVCGVGTGWFRSLLSGFWYNDLYRVGASMALVCLPLSCRGFVLLDDLIARAVTSLGYRGFVQNRKIASCVVLALSALVVYMPSFLIPGRAWITTAFGDIEDKLLRVNDVTSVIGPEEESLYYDVSDIFDLDEYLLAQPHELGIMSTDESEFMAEVASVVENDALILNQPHDGSVFGNIEYGLNLYYLTTSTPSPNSESFESRMVRTGLYLYGNSFLVHDAVEKLGADYLLLLDVDGTRSGNRYWYGHYHEKDWVGINAVNDDTPGFEAVLSRGDMRLYRIVR